MQVADLGRVGNLKVLVIPLPRSTQQDHSISEHVLILYCENMTEKFRSFLFFKNLELVDCIQYVNNALRSLRLSVVRRGLRMVNSCVPSPVLIL